MIIKLIKTLLIIYHITIIQLLFKQLRSESCDKVKLFVCVCVCVKDEEASTNVYKYIFWNGKKDTKYFLCGRE